MVAVVAVLGALIGFGVGSAHAATFTVTTTADGGAGSLRQAVADANTAGGASTIVLAASIYQLTNCGAGALTFTTGPITIVGNGGSIQQTCAGARVVDQTSNTGITVQTTTIFGGDSTGDGGGIRSAGPVILDHATVGRNTSATSGGGISSQGAVTVQDSTVEDNVSNGAGPGGITSSALTTVLRSTVSRNSAPGGVGGIFTTSAAVTASTLIGNSGSSGALLAVFDAQITDTTVAENTATGAGGSIGGVGSASGFLTVTGSTIRDNVATFTGAGLYSGELGMHVISSRVTGNLTATGPGGGAAALSGDIQVDTSTFDGNHAGTSGGAISTIDTIRLTNSTITDNVATTGGGLAASRATLSGSTIASNTGTVANVAAPISASTGAVVAYPLGGVNCRGGSATTAAMYDDDGTCGFGAGAGDVSDGADPLLGLLADNGGPTPTRLPAGASPMIEGVPAAVSCLATDQRGIARPQRVRCDIGAVEVAPVPPATTTTTTTSMPATTTTTSMPATTTTTAMPATTTTTARPATTTTTAPGSTTTTAAVAGLASTTSTPAVATGSLPVTGGPDGALTILGAGLVLTGAGVVALSVRRRLAQ